MIPSMEIDERKSTIITGLLLLLTATVVALGIWAWKLMTAAKEAEKNIPREKANIRQMRAEGAAIERLREEGARYEQIPPLQFHQTLSAILRRIRPNLTPVKVTESVSPRPIGNLREIAHTIHMQNVSREEFGKMIFYLEKELPGLKAKDISIPKWSATDLNRIDSATVWMVYYVPVKK